MSITSNAVTTSLLNRNVIFVYLAIGILVLLLGLAILACMSIACYHTGFMVETLTMKENGTGPDSGFAATIDDPNHSSRSIMMFLPAAPLGLAFSVMDNAEGLMMQILSLFPLTSFAAMPLRMANSAVPMWEWALSLALFMAVIRLASSLAAAQRHAPVSHARWNRARPPGRPAENHSHSPRTANWHCRRGSCRACLHQQRTPPQPGQVVLRHSGSALIGDFTPSSVTSSGSTTGRSDSGTGTAPHWPQ